MNDPDKKIIKVSEQMPDGTLRQMTIEVGPEIIGEEPPERLVG